MSTAKSMANQYLSAKRAAAASKSSTLSLSSQQQQHRFKSSTSNLASNSISTRSGLKATSMTNLASVNNTNSNTATRLQRPASRNALDSIHNGMNAKYARVQSKVLLQNIRPQQQQQPPQSKIPASKTASGGGETLTRRAANVTGLRSTPSPVKAPNERSAMINRLKCLQEELDKGEQERESLRQELERERADKLEQVQQIKSELQEKLAEHDKQSEEYHQKLLEAYELADQNRRAADQVLNESRQRAEESRKKTEELEAQLNELKEFVAMKEEMTDKMYELKEQIREERQRYEEQLKSLHQVFENEKIRKNQDQNSNYFSRIKPSLGISSESISATAATERGCQKCRSGPSQLHKSEQDMYGSKLSTRMQDTAKSAWKSSKKFASSVITGGVNLTGCRKGSGGAELNNRGHINTFQPQPQPQQPMEMEQEFGQRPNDQSVEHLSVIQVNGSAVVDSSLETQHQQQQQQQDSSLIRVDASKKLTIVTKFNDELLHQNGTSPGTEMAPSSGSSERSRCESSSSGRGTSSDAGSAASQNGDDKDDQQQRTPETKAQQTTARPAGGESEGDGKPREKTHKRKGSSSLFKASRVVFGGSQASLNKLKNFFNGGGGGKQLRTPQQQQQQSQLNQIAAGELSHQVSNGGGGNGGIEQQSNGGEIADAESARLRCMELNQAIRVPSISGQQQGYPSCFAASSLATGGRQCKLSLVVGGEEKEGDANENGNENENEITESNNTYRHKTNDAEDDKQTTVGGKAEIGQGESEIGEQQEPHQQAQQIVCCQ